MYPHMYMDINKIAIKIENIVFNIPSSENTFETILTMSLISVSTDLLDRKSLMTNLLDILTLIRRGICWEKF